MTELNKTLVYTIRMDQLPQNVLENILSSLGPQAASRFGATSREVRHAFQQTGIATAATLDASEKLQKAVRERQRKPFVHYEKLQSLSGPGNPPPGPGLPNMLFPNHYHDPRKFQLTRALRNSIGGARMTAMMGPPRRLPSPSTRAGPLRRSCSHRNPQRPRLGI